MSMRRALPGLTLLILLALLAGCARGSQEPAIPTGTPTINTEPSLSPTAVQPSAFTASGADRMLLALRADPDPHVHLYLFDPATLQFTRLTDGAWDDITPALSPDRTRVAVSARRNGYWDLYLLDLASGQIARLTDTLTYDAGPSWSPDGKWLIYATYVDENLDLFVLSVDDPNQPPIRLTADPALDNQPAWSPLGRQIAFVSSRGGQADIWLADLDRTGPERYTNLSNTPAGVEAHPAWSSDGRLLAWSSTTLSTGLSGIYVWDSTQPDHPPVWIGAGDWPAWNPDGNALAVILKSAQESYLTAYSLDGGLLLAPHPLPGLQRGLQWMNAGSLDPLPAAYAVAAARTPAALWAPLITSPGEAPGGRWELVPLTDVQAPYPQLHDLANEAFEALRARVVQEAGWDALANLQNAFVPLSAPLDPGAGEDWLYTGRAFELNPVLLNAGWLVVLREDVGSLTYWRLYLRTQAQDGSQGEPLPAPPWDLNARYSLDPGVYEQGGRFAAEVPSGYWIDLTALAAQYGWERLPAFSNWRTYYAGTRATQFALTGGLDWRAAILELYPPEVMITPTVVIPPTRTPTRTPWGYVAPTATPTPSPRPTLAP